MSDFDLLKGRTPDFTLEISSLTRGSIFTPLRTHSLASPQGKGGTSFSLHDSPPLALDLLPDFLQVTAARGSTSILTSTAPSREGSVDWGDVVTWVAEGAALGTGLGLVFGSQERPFQALGGGLLMTVGMGLLLEMVDRLVRNDHEFRWLRIGLSLVAGLLMGLDIQFTPSLDRSGIGSPPSDGRNPTVGVGP